MHSFFLNLSSFIAAFFFLAAPVFAQPSETAPSAALLHLRQDYVDSLKRLLQQYVKDNNVAGAAVVSEELNKVTPLRPDTAPNLSPCGRWRFDGDTLLTITPDGIATNVQNKGIWHWTDQVARQLQIEWRNGYVDKVTVSPDGTAMLFNNNLDKKFFAHRLPDDEKNTEGTSRK